MEKPKIGIVGFGHRGRELAKVLGLFDDKAVLAAACDIRPHNWYETQWLSDKPMAEMFPDTAFYTDYDEMLEKAGLDAVIVETGADIHAEFCAKALRKDINVLTDIPVVANLKEAEQLWRASEESKGVIYVGSNPNYQKFVVMLQDFYNKGLLGKPYCMEAEYIHWSMPGGAHSIHLNENGDWRKLLVPIRYCTHSLGPLLSITDEYIRKATCFGTGPHADPACYGGFKKDDMMCAQFQTDSGIVIRVMRNGRCRAKIGCHNYRVFGTEGYMEKIERYGKPAIRWNSMKELDTEMKEVTGEYMPPAYADDPKAQKAGHGGVDYAMMDHFIKALLGDEKAQIISLKDGLAMTIPGIYAEESAKRGGEVLTVRYPWDAGWTCEFI